jgi:hypothetical protein
MADLKLESDLPLASLADTPEEEADEWRAAGYEHIVGGPGTSHGPGQQELRRRPLCPATA